MKRFTRFTSVFGGFALLVFATQAFGGAICGPGPGWVGSCPGGFYPFTSVSNFNISLDLDNNLGDGYEINNQYVQTTGTTDIFLAHGSGNQMDSEVYALSERVTDPLSFAYGSTIIAGDGIGNASADGPLYSGGTITEQLDSQGHPTGFANSSYHVFFLLTIPTAGLVLHNHTTEPLTVTCENLTGVPPYGCNYRMIDNVAIGLYDSANTLKGQLLPSNLGHHIPTPSPEPASGLLLAGSLILLGALTRRCRRN